MIAKSLSTSARRRVMLAGAAAVALGACAFGGTASAQTVCPGSAGSDGGGFDTNVVCGVNSTTANGLGSIAVGSSAQAQGGVGNTAIGVGANANGDNIGPEQLQGGNTSLGDSSLSYGDRSQNAAVGAETNATGNDAENVAFGHGANASGNVATNIAIGSGATAAGDSNGLIAVGAGSTASGQNGIALGVTSTASGNFSAALGNNSTASGNSSVALGAGSVADQDNVVAVGSAINQRKIINMADGTIAAGSKDAVNGGQLSATNDRVTALEAGAGSALAVANAAQAAADAAQTTADTAITNAATAQTTADNAQTTANTALTTANTAITRGDGLGESVATALGGGSVYDPVTATVSAPSYTIGTTAYGSVGSAFQAINTTGAKYFHTDGSLPDGVASGVGSTAIGGSATASGARSLAVGSGSTASGTSAVAVGDTATASGANSAAFGPNAKATAANSVALGNGSVADQANTVSVGSAANQRRITNVADGTAPSDGATVRQIGASGASVAAALGGGATANAAGVISAPTYNLYGLSYNDVGSALGGIESFATDARREARRGIAGAVAMSSAPMPSAPGKTSWVVNTGAFAGEVAFGGSIAHRFNTETPFAFTAGYAIGGDQNVFRLGLAGEF